MTGSLDLDALEAVARAATPGPWKESGLDDEPTVIHYFDTEWSGPGYGPHVYPDKPEDAIFIAAFDPPTVLALIGRVREAEAALAELRAHPLRHLANDNASVVIDVDNIAYDEEFHKTLKRADAAEAVIQAAYNALHLESRARAVEILHAHLALGGDQS